MAARLVLIPLPMSDSPRFDVSVILPFGDDEEFVGIAVRRTAEHLRGLGLSFEILAIDEDSGDNSHAVLALLRAEVPELRVTHAPGRGRGVDVGAVARAGHAARRRDARCRERLARRYRRRAAAACSPVKATPRSRSRATRSRIAFARSSRSAVHASSVLRCIAGSRSACRSAILRFASPARRASLRRLLWAGSAPSPLAPIASRNASGASARDRLLSSAQACTTLLALLSLGFLIVVHEGGHYFVARWCRMRIERFSIGFGPGHPEAHVEEDRHDVPARADSVRRLRRDPRHEHRRGRRSRRRARVSEPSRVAALRDDLRRPRDELSVGDRARVRALHLPRRGQRVALVQRRATSATDYDAYGQARGRRSHPRRRRRAASSRAASTTRPTARTIKARLAHRPRHREEGRAGHAHRPARRQEASTSRSRRSSSFRDLPTTTRRRRYLLGIVPIEQPDVLDVGVLDAGAGRARSIRSTQTKMIVGGLYDIITGKEEADPGGPKRIFDEFAKAWELGIGHRHQAADDAVASTSACSTCSRCPRSTAAASCSSTYELVTRRRANPKIEAMVHMGGIMVLGVVMILVTLRDFHVFYADRSLQPVSPRRALESARDRRRRPRSDSDRAGRVPLQGRARARSSTSARRRTCARACASTSARAATSGSSSRRGSSAARSTDVETIVVSSSKEALLLENHLIKKHQPRST